MPTLPWARGRLAPVCQPAFCMPSVVFPGAASSVRIAPSLSALPLTPLPPPPARLPRRIRQFYVYMLAVKAPEFSVCIFPCQRAASSVSLWPSVGVLPNPPPPRAPSVVILQLYAHRSALALLFLRPHRSLPQCHQVPVVARVEGHCDAHRRHLPRSAAHQVERKF